MVLAYLDVAGDMAGFTGERGGQVVAVGPVPMADAPFFSRMIEQGGMGIDVAPEPSDRDGPIGAYIFTRPTRHVVWAPITQHDRGAAGSIAMRNDGRRLQPRPPEATRT